MLLELLGQPPVPSYRFETQEVKQVTFRFDGLLLLAHPGLPLYFLECQFQKDKHFYLRLFGEIALYLKQKRYYGEWRAVVLFARPSLDPGVPVFYQSFEESGLLHRLYLKPIAQQPGSLRLNILQLVVVSKPQLQRRVAQMVQQVQAEVEQGLAQEKILELLSTLLVYKFPERERRELEMAFGLTELSKTRVYQEAKEEGRVEGEQAGVVRGKKEGKLEGKLEAVPALLTRGFSVEETAQILGLSVAQVQSVQP